MEVLLAYLFGAAAFVPHGYCLLWRPDLVAMHAISDGLIALAYFSIPAAIYTFVRRRPDFRHHRVAGLFILFITLCGVTHVIGVWTLWQPVYGLQGLVKLLTALVSVATAIALWPLIPKLLALPSPALLAEKAERLEAEIRRRELVELALRAAYADLERRVAERTHDLAAAKAEAEHEALHDGLTQLANRRCFQQRLDELHQESLEAQSSFALFVADLDDFKQVNDTHGHLVGDAILIEVARRLSASVRQYDLVARLGGDEFAILARSCTDNDDARRLARRLVATLQQPFRHEGHELWPRASIGIALTRPSIDDPTSLFASADRAVYAAKRAGGNCWRLFAEARQASPSPA